MENFQYENPVSHKMQVLSKIGSEIRDTFMIGHQLRAGGLDLIDLSLGNPDLEPPPIVNEKLCELLKNEKNEGAHRYMDSAGLLDVREFLAKELTISEQVPITGENVYLTVGAAGALQICMRAFVHEGDEVIIFVPYFPEYRSYAHNLNAIPVIVDSDDNHIPIFEQLEEKISSKTKLVIINSPNNPSGVYYSQIHLKKIFSILEQACKKFNRIIPVISDEPYMRLLYVEPNPSMLLLYPYTFLVRSLSKDLGLAGERIGYFAWRKDFFEFSAESHLLDIFRNAARVSGFVCAPRLMQRLIPYVFYAKVNIAIYQERVKFFVDQLQSHQIQCIFPSAGFFIFPKTDIRMSDQDFCLKLAHNGLLSVCGSAFGKKNYARISLTQPLEKIQKACELYIKAMTK